MVLHDREETLRDILNILDDFLSALHEEIYCH